MINKTSYILVDPIRSLSDAYRFLSENHHYDTVEEAQEVVDKYTTSRNHFKILKVSYITIEEDGKFTRTITVEDIDE